MRRIQIAILTAGLVVMTAAPAGAGGSWLDPSWERVEAGDWVELSGSVSRGAYGWLDDGPFFTYLQGATTGLVTAAGTGGAVTDIPLGPLTVRERNGSVTASLSFAVPDELPPGEYWIKVCNDPCTTGLGDLIGGVIYVGMDPPPAGTEATSVLPVSEAVASVEPSEATAPTGDTVTPLRLALAPAPTRPADLSPIWVGISAALGGAVLLTALLSRHRGEDSAYTGAGETNRPAAGSKE